MLNGSSTPGPSYGGLIADGHVHLYDCYNLARFLDGAYVHLAAAARLHANMRDPALALMLTQTRRERGFERLRDLSDRPEGQSSDHTGSWRILTDQHAGRLIARHRRGQELLIFAGHQIVTLEGLEALALGTQLAPRESQTLKDSVAEIVELGGIPVIPWGVGKWIGKRGRVVLQYVRARERPRVFLGDILGRPALWPRSRAFKIAETHEVGVLPGTDPLPLRSEEARAGQCGFIVDEPLPEAGTIKVLQRRLMSGELRPKEFTRRESFTRFCSNQTRLRIG